MRVGLFVRALLMTTGACNAASAAVVTGFEGFSDWSSLPNRIQGTAGLASSYNRTVNLTPGQHSRSDYNNFESFDANGYGLVKEITGASGAITRFWMPHLTADSPADIRLTIDGTVYNTTAPNLFNGSFGTAPQFSSPLVATKVGGRASYEPITFQNSIKIEMRAQGQPLFYQWDYRLHQAGTTSPSFNGGPTADQTTARSKAATTLTNVGQNPAGVDAGATNLAHTSLNVPAKGSVTLANVNGSGQVRSLLLKLRDASPSSAMSTAQLDSLRVRVRYDGAADYAIDVPVSHFFGVGHGRVDYKSVPVGVADDGSYYSHWPMPYRQNVTIELYNDATTAVAVPAASVEYKPGTVAADAQYLHAKVTTATTTAGQTSVRLLQASGGGHYVGNFLWTTGGFNTLEGNDIITVDGTRILNGTGLEDAYNGGYYYNGSLPPEYLVNDHGDVPNSYAGTLPLSGLLGLYGEGTAEQYRWRLTDAVPFENGLTLDMENVDGQAGVQWGMTGFFYSTQVPEPGSTVLAVLAGAGVLATRSRRVRLQ